MLKKHFKFILMITALAPVLFIFGIIQLRYANWSKLIIFSWSNVFIVSLSVIFYLIIPCILWRKCYSMV